MGEKGSELFRIRQLYVGRDFVILSNLVSLYEIKFNENVSKFYYEIKSVFGETHYLFEGHMFSRTYNR